MSSFGPVLVLEGERRKKHALRVSALAIKNLINLGICPQWDTRCENTASIRLAEQIGFETFGCAYILMK